ncbi:MAG: hypothetical protein Ct9H300mP28_23140 [Pseudomonadota bacterium]|nr:MAG: hypothetical protein Ct9H300mP28_23140 [Pseudomonadota bacterium]
MGNILCRKRHSKLRKSVSQQSNYNFAGMEITWASDYLFRQIIKWVAQHTNAWYHNINCCTGFMVRAPTDVPQLIKSPGRNV